MEKLDKIGCYEFLSEPFHCDFSHRLFLGHLGNHMLNAADFHSNDRGFGMNYPNPLHKTWVLSRLAIEMQRFPEAYERFCVKTWVEGAMRYFTDRDFAVTTTDGTPYGYGRSIWALIDTDSRQPTDILSIRDGEINHYIDTETSCPIAKSSRVKMSADAEFVRSLRTCYSDVDVNGHINSVKYIEHVVDLWPVDWFRTHRIARFEIAYVAEAHGGDTLHFYREETAPDEYCVRIVKQESEDADKVEVCRSKVKFVKD